MVKFEREKMNINQYNTLQNRFFNYVDIFKEENGDFCFSLKEKLSHINRVTENALYISENEKWSENDCLIAKLCGLFHDIGRFSQYKKFKTFSDNKSVNHGQQGFDVINSNNLFEGIDLNESQIILDAVHYHNSLQIPENLSSKSKSFTNLTRDADKIDIFFMLTNCIENNTLESHQDLLWNLPMEGPNPIIVEKLLNNSNALYSEIKSGTDVCLLQLCWLYEMNYNSSLVKINENKTVELLATIMPKSLEVEKCVKHISQYIKHRLANN